MALVHDGVHVLQHVLQLLHIDGDALHLLPRGVFRLLDRKRGAVLCLEPAGLIAEITLIQLQQIPARALLRRALGVLIDGDAGRNRQYCPPTSCGRTVAPSAAS